MSDVRVRLDWVIRDLADCKIEVSELKHRVNMLEVESSDLKDEIARLRDTVGVLNRRTAGLIQIGGP